MDKKGFLSLRRFVRIVTEGGFQFKDLDDGRLTLNAIVIKSKVIGNIYDNPELLKTDSND